MIEHQENYDSHGRGRMALDGPIMDGEGGLDASFHSHVDIDAISNIDDNRSRRGSNLGGGLAI